MSPPTATKPEAPTPNAELDLAFCCDCTGSMGSYIKSAQENIRLIAESIGVRTAQRASVRYALVKYRDHPPQDRTFVTETFPFTESIELMKRHIDTMAASGGGDGPEAVSAALHELNELPWRPNATKVCVLISDAPPHGLEESGDGFPQGCPLGHDPVKICQAMAAKAITVYAVGVEPILSTSYQFARDFMMMVAQITDGKFLPLGRAAILSDVIVNGALEGMNMKELWEQLEKDVEKEASANGEGTLQDDALVQRVEKKLAEKKDVQMAQVDVSNPYMDHYDMENVDRMVNATSFSSARAQLDSKRNAHVSALSAGFTWSQQEQQCRMSTCAPEQKSRMACKAKKSKGLF